MVKKDERRFSGKLGWDLGEKISWESTTVIQEKRIQTAHWEKPDMRNNSKERRFQSSGINTQESCTTQS